MYVDISVTTWGSRNVTHKLCGIIVTKPFLIITDMKVRQHMRASH